MKRSIVISAVTALALACLLGTAQANLIINGDFETGDLTGWTDSGSPRELVEQGNIPSDPANWTLAMSATPNPTLTYQPFGTIAADTMYTVTYDAANYPPYATPVNVGFYYNNGGTWTELSKKTETPNNQQVLTEYTFDWISEAAYVGQSIAVGFGTDSGAWSLLDNVVVTAGVPVYPEADQNGAFDVPQIGAVTIDGNLADWSNSTAWSEPFILWNDNGAPLTSTTKAKFAWNDAGDMLYVAIQTDQASGGHAVVGVGITVDDVPVSGVGSTQLAFDAGPGTSVAIMNEIAYYGGVGGTDDVVAAQTNDGTTWTYELAIPYWKNWVTMTERQTISANDEYYVYLVMEDVVTGGNGTDMTYEGNPQFYNGAFDVGSKLTFKSSQIPGDANNDGKVDGSDVTILAGNWQVLTGATWAMGDFNADGKVDGSDVTILAGNWQAGVSTTAASVPEPGVLALLLGAIVTLFAGYRVRRS